MKTSKLVETLKTLMNEHGDGDIMIIVPTPGGRVWKYYEPTSVGWGTHAALNPMQSGYAIRVDANPVTKR